MIKRNKFIHIAIAILYVVVFCCAVLYFSPKNSMTFSTFVFVSISGIIFWFHMVFFFALDDAIENRQGDIESKFISNVANKIQKLANRTPKTIMILVGSFIVFGSAFFVEYMMQIVDPTFRLTITQLFD